MKCTAAASKHLGLFISIVSIRWQHHRVRKINKDFFFFYFSSCCLDIRFVLHFDFVYIMVSKGLGGGLLLLLFNLNKALKFWRGCH